MAVANCPACGGPIEFKIGSSVVVVCDHCRSAVARTDRGLEDLGKVAALIDTGSPLRRDLPGKIRGNGFRIVGRTQMRHPMGGVWDEWYAAFDSGQWGWLAEAQGKYYLTVKKASQGLPPYGVLQIGGTVDGLTITELATATVVSGEGEIPFRVVPGDTYQYADLSGPNRRFGTIDYSEDPPLLFEGEETTLAELGIDIRREPARTTRVGVQKLSCSQCGGPLTLVAPDQAERVICPHCGAAHDVTEGNLQYLQTFKRKGPQPLIPLGGKGTIGGTDYVVAGFMQRSVTFDKKYYWTEYLLFAPATKSFAWLVDDDGHWSFVLPLGAGDLSDGEPGGAATRITAHGTTFLIFQDAVATVESVIGEFYWKVEAGEQARAVDYIAPPEGITKEFSDTAASHEVNYSLARYMPPDELEAAFGVKGLPRPATLGTLQPASKGGCALFGLWLLLLVCLLAVTIFIVAIRPDRTLLTQAYDLSQFASSDWSSGGGQPPPAVQASNTEGSAIVFTKPFAFQGGHRILLIKTSSGLTNDWLYLGGDVYNESTGLLQPFEIKLEHYEGVDDGEHWTEGSSSGHQEIASLPAGTYALRVEAHWDGTKPPPTLHLNVVETGYTFSGGIFLLIALALITLPALLSMKSNNDNTRWADAMFTRSGQRNE